MAYFSSSEGGEMNPDGFRAMFGPGHVDSVIRSAINMCWLSLPDERRNVGEVERQIRRLVDRALENLREDGEAFFTSSE